MLQLLSRLRPRDLCKSLEVGRIERYSILGYLPPTPDDSQCKQVAVLGFQLDAELTSLSKPSPRFEDALQHILSRPYVFYPIQNALE